MDPIARFVTLAAVAVALAAICGCQGLSLEVLQSIQALDQSQREYLRAVGDYDQWQFRLYRAVGCPIPPHYPSKR